MCTSISIYKYIYSGCGYVCARTYYYRCSYYRHWWSVLIRFGSFVYSLRPQKKIINDSHCPFFVLQFFSDYSVKKSFLNHHGSPDLTVAARLCKVSTAYYYRYITCVYKKDYRGSCVYYVPSKRVTGNNRNK